MADAPYSYRLLRWISSLALIVTVTVIALGALTRLTDAGLGCPDWPGCYGQLAVPKHASHIDTSIELYQRPLEKDKAWMEMIHRYFASSLGLFMLAIAILGWKNRRHLSVGLTIPIIMIVLVCFQGALGMWTVTLGLLPVIVMGHLLGGFTLACLLLLWNLRLRAPRPQPVQLLGGKPIRSASAYLKRAVKLGAAMVFIQIALGGWTAANYAATVCTELPICQDGWMQMFSFKEAVTLHAEGFDDFEFAPHLSTQAKVSIHVMHRLGAIVVTVFLLWLAAMLWRKAARQEHRKSVKMLIAVLGLQVGLGVSNVVFELPLAIAVAHNVMGLTLLLTLILIHERYPFSLMESHHGQRGQPT